MEGFARALEQLRDAALAEPPAFSRVLQKLLTSDFDATFYQVKTQKLVLKRRSSQWISDLESEMSLWLPSAPLKGKQKSQVTHHLRVSRVLQQLFEIVDEESAALRIWQASTEDLLRELFAFVEDRRTAAESLQSRQGLQHADPLSAMKQSEIDRLELRYLCDYVTRIVNHASAGAPRGASTLSLPPQTFKTH